MTVLGKYLWLIRLLHGTDGKTFEAINEEWLKFRRNTEDENIPILKRTFFNHIKAIREEYDIHIECGSGYKYHIANPDKDVLPKIELLSVLNLLSETVTDSKLNQSLYVDEYLDLFRDIKVMTIMDAIKTKHKVRFAKFRNVNMPDKYLVLNVAPYQLHYICSQWFVIGNTDEYGLMRIPLAYYRGVRITDTSYKFPANYSAIEYSKMLYGVTSDKIHLIIEIKHYNPQELNLCNYPLIPFQQGIEYKQKQEEDRTVDFIMNNSAKISFELPKSPFVFYTLKRRLEKYHYKVINDTNPFLLFSEEQYDDAVSTPTIL